MELHLQCFWKG